MVELRHTVVDQLGFHARSVARVSAEAARWESAVQVCHKGRCVSADNIMALMGLEAHCGDELVVQIEGPDEQDASEFFEHLLRGL